MLPLSQHGLLLLSLVDSECDLSLLSCLAAEVMLQFNSTLLVNCPLRDVIDMCVTPACFSAWPQTLCFSPTPRCWSTLRP
jgi:hypothetical protein